LPTKEKNRIGDAAARSVGVYSRRSFENGEKVLDAIRDMEAQDDEGTVTKLRNALTKSIASAYNDAVALRLIPGVSPKASSTNGGIPANSSPGTDAESSPENGESTPAQSEQPQSVLDRMEALCNELVALEIREISPGDQARLRDLATRINAMVNSLPATTPIPYIESAATAEAGNNGDTSAAA